MSSAVETVLIRDNKSFSTALELTFVCIIFYPKTLSRDFYFNPSLPTQTFRLGLVCLATIRRDSSCALMDF